MLYANADESLLNMAAKAHGNPFLVSELVGGLDEEGRLNVSGGRAVASGQALPRRLEVWAVSRIGNGAIRHLAPISCSELSRCCARLA